MKAGVTKFTKVEVQEQVILTADEFYGVAFELGKIHGTKT